MTSAARVVQAGARASQVNPLDSHRETRYFIYMAQIDRKTEDRIRELADAVTRDLRAANYGDEMTRTPALHAAADKIVELRALHTTPKGEVDWQGRSWPYRQLISDIYNNSGLDPAPNSAIKAALRYHLGQVLRERLTEDELEAAGLKPTSPRDRAGLKYRQEGDEATFMEGIFLHMLRTPGLPLPITEEQLERARRNASNLSAWLETAKTATPKGRPKKA